jgi:hypothetical protein
MCHRLISLGLGLALGVSAARADSSELFGLSKRQLVARVGLPAEIHLQTSGEGPAREIWSYWCKQPDGQIRQSDVYFAIGTRVTGVDSSFDPARLISTEDQKGFDRVYYATVRRDERLRQQR